MSTVLNRIGSVALLCATWHVNLHLTRALFATFALTVLFAGIGAFSLISPDTLFGEPRSVDGLPPVERIEITALPPMESP